MKDFKKYIIPFLCLVNVFIHLSSIFYLEFHRDELLYFSLSNHLDLGYASVPPFVSWLAYIAKGIFGFSPFAVKIFPALVSGIFIYLCTKIAKEFGGGWYAEVLTAVLIMCTPLSLRAFILFQPVPFDIFFWTLTLYILLKYIHSKEDKWLYMLGITVGIALLNKYLILFLLLSLFAALPFTQHRVVFKNKAFYLSLLITLVIVSPNLYWQITNDFPAFQHMEELSSSQLENVTVSEFFLGQIGMFLFAFVLSLVGLLNMLLVKKNKQYRIFSLAALGVIFLLLITNGKDYYAAGIYPFLTATGVVKIVEKVYNKYLRLGIILFLILGTIPFAPLGIPFMPPEKLASHFDKMEELGIPIDRVHENGNEYRLPQDYADMLAWYTIADLAKEAYEMVEDKNTTAIFGENYGIAGAVSLIGKKYGLPEALSFSDTYAYWVPESFDPDIESFIYINDELGSDVEALFENIFLVGRVEDPLSRQFGVEVYLCTKPRRSFNEFWSETLKAVRAR